MNTGRPASPETLRDLHMSARSVGWGLTYEVKRGNNGLYWIIRLEKQGIALVARASSLAESLGQMQALLRVSGRMRFCCS